MSYANLGWWLKDNGFGDAQWLNQMGAPQSYAFHPEFPIYDEVGFPKEKGFDLRYGDGSLKAKGWENGRPHGGNLDLIQSLIRLPDNPLRFDNNQGYVISKTDKSDLNYLPGAWKQLLVLAAGRGLTEDPAAPKGENKDEPSDLSTIEVRTGEIQGMLFDLLDGYKDSTIKSLRDIVTSPLAKVFIAAAMKAYRKIMGG